MKIEHRKILTMPVAVTSYDEVVQWINTEHNSSTETYSGKYICAANVHMCMESHDDQYFRNVVSEADIVVPDGRPLVWALRALGKREATQVRGADLMLKVCEDAEQRGYFIGLYGTTDATLLQLTTVIRKQFPKIIITFTHAPPFRPLTESEDSDVVNAINTSRIKVLFVATGCPKQEIWMREHRESLSCTMIGVGAAFDFISGNKNTPPKWMQTCGLEWVFRLANEPRRLWKRYYKHNPRFIWLIALQLYRQVKIMNRHEKNSHSGQ